MAEQIIKTKYGNAHIDSNGYYRISTRDKGNFEKYLHRLIYEDHYGEIPKGYIVHHKNENKLDNRIENLELLSRAEHTILHSTGNQYWLGKKHTEETKQKISKTHKGKKYSEERIQQMRKTFGGKNNPMYGKHHSEETKQKIRDSHFKKYARIIHGGIRKGKRVYIIKDNSKAIKSSFYPHKLIKWFTETHPNRILKISEIKGVEL